MKKSLVINVVFQKGTLFFILFFLLVNLSISSNSSNNKTPNEAVNYLIELFKSYNKAEKGEKLTKEQKEENAIIASKIEKIFNFDKLIYGTIQDQLTTMTVSQKNDFFNTFKDLIKLVAYPQGSYFYNNSKNEFKEALMKDGKAYVESNNYNYDKDLDISIAYVMQNTEGNWMLVDVTMNEHSLIEAYRLQINRIVRKKGLEGLMSVLKEKHKEIKEN